jgi:hypothetical protein
MITVETYADLPRKLGHHAFVVLALIQGAEMMGIRPVSAQWLYDHAPGYGKGKITDSLRILTSVENQFVIHVTGGWQLNRDEAFQLPLGYILAGGKNRPENDSRIEIVDGELKDEPDLVFQNHPENDSENKATVLEVENEPDLVFQNHSECDTANKNRPENDSCFLETPENRPENDSQTRNPLKTLKSLNQVVVGDNLNLITPTTNLSDGGKNETGWGAENKRMLDASEMLFGDGYAVIARGLDLDAIPEQFVRGWLNQAYFLMSKGSITQKIAAGTVYNRLKDYPESEKPKPTFLHAEADAYLPEEYLIEIGVKRKICERCQVEFEDLAAYEAHQDDCTWTPAPEPSAEIEPDETITDQVLAIWESALEMIRADIPRASFDTWVRDIYPVHVLDRQRMTIAVKNIYARDWLANRMQRAFERALGGMTVDFVVSHGQND